MLLGREREQAQLDELLEDARAGRSRVLVVRGEAGIGKTALLDYAAERATDMTVVRALGVESEAEIEFSALLEVVRPLLGLVDELPPAQAAALRGALGLAAADVGDRFAIGAATLGLITAAAEHRPVLVVVDDAHWLDGSSAEALLFAARRLDADRVAALVAFREGESHRLDASGLDVLLLHGLDARSASAILERAGQVARPVAEQLYRLTRGNPLALLELPSVLSEAQLAGTEPLDDPLPVGVAIERSFARRAAALGEDERRALLAASLSTSSDLEPLEAALGELGLPEQALAAAVAAGLIRVSGARFEFHHPLVRSAVSQTAAPSERRLVHRALARALDGGRDDERRAWHLAAAALGADEEAAAALEAAARRARERTGFSAAARAFERAAGLSPDDRDRARRLAAGAEAAWQAGSTTRATALLDEALGRTSDPRLCGGLLALRGRIEHLTGPVASAQERLLRAARLLEPTDPVAAAAVLTDAAEAYVFAGEAAAGLAAAERARGLAPRDGGAEDVLAELALGEALVHAGRFDEAAGHLERGTATVLEDGERHDDPRLLARAVIGLGYLERSDEARRLGERAVALARDRGAAGALPYALEALQWQTLRSGRWTVSVTLGTEARSLAQITGQSSVLAHVAVELGSVAAGRGRDEECRRLVGESFVLAASRGVGLVAPWGECVLGLLELGTGRVEEAAARLERVAAEQRARGGLYDRDACPHPDLVEAAVRLGDLDRAAAALGQLEQLAPGLSPRWRAPLLARCRGLLAADDAFEPKFRESLDAHQELDDPFALGRTLLCLGERLRRAGRRRDARVELRRALELFERLGATPWIDRTAAELRASGETLRRRDPEHDDELTPQELQIALLVAEGRTNRDVGAALFLSPKTIEFHLSRIYRKLGVRSRAELIRKLAPAPTA